MSEIDEIISNLRGLDLSTYPFSQTQELIRSLGHTGFLVITLHRGKRIIRARSGDNYSTRNELTYLSQVKNLKCKRASTPNKTMFYGSIIQDSQSEEENRMIAASETSNLLREGIDTTGIEKITYGRWLVIKDINLIALINENTYANVLNNPFLSELKSAYNKSIKSTPGFETKNRKINSFFVEEFSKSNIKYDYDYFLSAMFTEIISYDLQFDGVIYPSVQIGGQLGFNVAIKPETVDNNMILDFVSESTLYKKGDISLNLIDKISELNTWKYVDSHQVTLDVILEKLHIKELDELI